jgi:hypothetical protein
VAEVERDLAPDAIECGSFHTHPEHDDTEPSHYDFTELDRGRGDLNMAAGRMGIIERKHGYHAYRYVMLIVTPHRERGWSAPTITPWIVRRRDGSPDSFVCEPSTIR